MNDPIPVPLGKGEPIPEDVTRFTLHTTSFPDQLGKSGDTITAAYRKRAEKDFLCFTRGLKIDGQNGPDLFDRVIAPFQRECFSKLAPSIQAVRDGKRPPTKRWWIERTKKAGKDSDLAIIILWVIAFPKRPFYAQVGAADKTQAAVVKERIVHLLYFNPWLNDYIELVQWEIRSKKVMGDGSPMAHLHIMSSDIAGAHGGTPDLLIINELSHIVKWEFVENLMDNADGVARGLVLIATNAGIKGTKAEVWRNAAIADVDGGWGFHIWCMPAPWHDKEAIEQARRRNSRSRFQRLWNGIWVSGKGDALDDEAIADCFTMKGPILKTEVGWEYIGGLDLGIKNDRTGLVILGVNTNLQQLKTCYWEKWSPAPDTGEVDLEDVAKKCLMMDQLYNLRGLFYDPFEARLMSQQLKKQAVPMQEMSFSMPSNLNRMASNLIQIVNSRKLKCYDDGEGSLRRDFGKFNILEKPYGYKLEAVRDESGHADVGTALVICIPAAFDMLEGSRGLLPTDDLVDMNPLDLSIEEVDDMPQELRELYDLGTSNPNEEEV